jgi:multiple sugar transport system permease protein
MLRRREQLLLFIPLLIVMLPFLIWPAFSGLIYSFTNYAPGQVHLRWVGLLNFNAVIGNQTYQTARLNMLLFLVIAIPAELIVGFALAYLLREPFRGRGSIRVLLLIPWLISPIAYGVIWHFLLNLQVGILNFVRSWLGFSMLPSPLGLIRLALLVTIATNVWHDAPLVCFHLLPGLLAIPPEDWEFPTLEGASTLNQIRYIALLWLRPLLFVVGLLVTGYALGAFDTVLILTGGGPGSATMTPALFSYVSSG